MTAAPSSSLRRTGSLLEKVMEKFIFSSRWLQAPLYLGLILAQGIYVYRFLVELAGFTDHIHTLDENEIILVVLGLIDIVMISNLLVMVIIGGYETFVSRLEVQDHRDIPEWLAHVNANTMKIKLALALIGISSIHLLKTFINVEHMPDRVVFWQVVIHTIFLFSAIFMAYTSKVAQAVTRED